MLSGVVMIKKLNNIHGLKKKTSQSKNLHSYVCSRKRSGCWGIDRYREGEEGWLWEKKMLCGVVMNKIKNSWSVETIKKARQTGNLHPFVDCCKRSSCRRIDRHGGRE